MPLLNKGHCRNYKKERTINSKCHIHSQVNVVLIEFKGLVHWSIKFSFIFIFWFLFNTLSTDLDVVLSDILFLHLL